MKSCCRKKQPTGTSVKGALRGFYIVSLTLRVAGGAAQFEYDLVLKFTGDTFTWKNISCVQDSSSAEIRRPALFIKSIYLRSQLHCFRRMCNGRIYIQQLCHSCSLHRASNVQFLFRLCLWVIKAADHPHH